MHTIVVVVSPFGLGHLTRQIALIKSISNLLSLNIRLVCSEQHQKFTKYLNLKNVEFHQLPQVPVMVMYDEFTIDKSMTIESYRRSWDFETQIRDDVAWGRILQDTDLVINDMECIHNPIVKKMGIPIVNISNFTWSDFLFDFGENELANNYVTLEKMASISYQLPFNTSCLGFEEPIKTGLLVNLKDEKRIAELRGDHDIIVLILNLPNILRNELESIMQKLNDLGIFTIIKDTEYMDKFDNILTFDLETNNLVDLIAASNVVIGKTGYGLTSECAYGGSYFLHWVRENSIEDLTLSEKIIDGNFGQRINIELGVDILIRQISAGLEHNTPKMTNDTDKIAKDINSRYLRS